MNLDDTIVAIATPPGRGGIGVVRLAGPEARAIAEPMLTRGRDLKPNQAIHCDLIDPCGADTPVRETVGTGTTNVATAAPGRPAEQSSAAPTRIDEVVVTYFAKPHSYTTDYIVEISAHGSPVVLGHIVALALARGARLAEPGEFTMRAFLNGRLDLTQAEAVRDLIDSQTLFQARVAAQQLEGALSNRLKPIKQKLVDLIALLEAGIDFAEDDISIASDDTIRDRIAEVRTPLEQLSNTFTYGKLVQQGLTLAIIGRPNVGKSSLFNRLVERERAIVTSQPGTTRDLVSETIAIGGIPVELVDTAGIRKALNEAESMGIKKSMEAQAEADLVLIVIDKSQALSREDDDLLTDLLTKIEGRPAIVVENKCDLPPAPAFATTHVATAAPGRQAEQSEARRHGRPPERSQENGALPITHVSTSALTGEGIPALRAAILHHIAGDSAQQEPGFLTNVRHQKLVNDALAALASATGALATRVPHEMLLLDLYAALRPLDEITGATTTDDILNLIFGTFCIGK